MLQIVPMAEKTEEAALLAKTEGAPDNGRVLVMTDGEETLGYVVVAIEDDTLVFYGFSVSGQTDFTKAKPDPMTTFVLDTLMRSAASFLQAARVCGCGRSRRSADEPHCALRIKPKMPQSETSLCGIASKLPRAAACGVLFFRKFRFSPAIGCIFRLKMVKYLDRIKVGYYVLCEEHKISRKT